MIKKTLTLGPNEKCTPNSIRTSNAGDGGESLRAGDHLSAMKGVENDITAGNQVAAGMEERLSGLEKKIFGVVNIRTKFDVHTVIRVYTQ